MKQSRTAATVLAALVAAATLAGEAHASTFSFGFSGAGVNGSLTLTYGSATDARYPDAFEVTAISGTFSDVNNGLNIVNAPVGSLVAVTRDTPEVDNLLAPRDFSRFPVAAGLSEGSLSFDNLLWPAGSPQTASDYPFHGGFLDIYGLMFQVGGGRVVNVWSNGVPPGSAGPVYGVAVATSSNALDYVQGGLLVTAVPEPAVAWLLAAGLLGVMLAARRRSPGA